jgi:transcriptional regulator with XRE-family HTH domain
MASKMTENFIINIKRRRQELKLTQKEAGKKIGVTASAYARKERGERRFLITEALLICNELDIAFDQAIKEGKKIEVKTDYKKNQ